MANVTVNFVEDEVEVSVDLNRLTWGDLLKIQRASGAGTTEQEAEELLNQVLTKVTGKDVADMPAVVVGEVLRAVMQRVQGSGKTEKN